MSRVPRLLVLLVAVTALATAAPALAKLPTFHRGLPPGKVVRASRHVIVVLKQQQRGALASASSVRARASAQARQRRPLIARISSAGGKVTRQFTTLNAFAAQVSPDQQAQLSQDSSVAAVVPDQVVALPQQDQGTPSGLTPVSPGNPSTPLSTTCPKPGEPPLLEGEYLQTMHVAYNDPTIPQAANLATGRGVRVAFFADGVDVNNPDFIRPDGSHVFIDYRDFTGEGPNAPSPAAEAFGDASSIAAQGRQVYDLSTFVNPAHPLPPGCNIRVRGVAPGASLIGMKVFGEGGSFTSVIIQGLDWAVTHDHADILSESFGGYAMPDTALDATKLFNDAAVRAGITVTQGTNDAGAHIGPTSPATDPNVIDTGGTTNFRAYAQTVSYAFQFADQSKQAWLNDNISSISGSGFSQNADTPDVVAPGEADWALCSPNPAIYEECTDFKDDPARLQQFGGVSQSTPLTAGAAALVIEGYRSTHRGQSPSAALVKQILLSTANDLGFPTWEQGTGEVDALKAVEAAMSVDGGRATGHSLLVGPSKLTFIQDAGTRADATFSVTNTGASTQTVSARARALRTPPVTDERQDVTLATGPGAPTFIDQFGSPRPFVTTHFTIPDGTDRLVADDAWAGPDARIGLTLIDPNGTYAAYTRPQGNGNHGEVDVRKPVGGTWTAIVFVRDGTFAGGPVHLEFSTQRFAAVDSISPASQTLRPGETGRFHYRTTLPSSPGDTAHDIVVSDSAGDATVLPALLRSLVRTNAHGGPAAGRLRGGNGRVFVAQTDTFQFDVPRGRKSLSVSLSWSDNAGTEAIGWLIGPDQTLYGSSSSVYVDPNTGADTPTHGLEAFAQSPQAGRWKFVITVTSPVGGTVLSTPYHGVVSFDSPQIRATGLPHGDRLRAGRPVTATVRVRNTGPGTMDVFADPRVADRSETDSLFPLFAPATVALPGANVPFFLVPTQADAVLGTAQGSQPIVLEMGYGVFGNGDPDLIGASRG